METPWADEKLVVGLTGGIACGKSTVLGFFQARGWETHSADAIVSDLLAKDSKVIAAIRKEFGSEVVLPEGGVDKRKLAAVVFSHSSKRSWLEQLIHPLVRAEWFSQVSRSAGTRHVVEIPLLFEKHLESLFSCVVSVFCSPNIQHERLIAQGMNNEEASARIAAQMPAREKADKADTALLNDGDLSHLEAQVDQFLEKLSKA
ncbi:MAG: dephospho-CoA kinase [Opitutae bacterium]|nr:dephospho-CoA kinase [Opitutae bacterium]|tara:strand:- start:2017 stop:2625 length:609 start_codon:yes stop_codon:yes gene_type:complete